MFPLFILPEWKKRATSHVFARQYFFPGDDCVKIFIQVQTSLVFPSVRVFDLYLHQLRETDGALSLAFASSMEIPIASIVLAVQQQYT